MSDGLHDVVVEVGPCGAVNFSFECRADPSLDPACHMVCPQSSCEEGCSDPQHVMKNEGECCIVVWLDNSDAQECIDGTRTRVRLPIRYSWHGEGVDWAFAGDPS